MTDIRRLEEAALNAWPALSQIFYDGWVLRFSKGYTKRGNSANVLSESRIAIPEKIQYCERVYAEKNLPAIFRISPLSPPELDSALEARKYRFFHPTWVMTLDFEDWAYLTEIEHPIETSNLDAWMKTYDAVSSSSVDSQSIHRQILQSMSLTCLWASLWDQNKPVSCGLGVLEDDYFGLFDIVTHPKRRGLGYGTQLIAGMVRWAIERGAKVGYLQVMEENEPARRLYSKLGYCDSYRYWYRVPG